MELPEDIPRAHLPLAEAFENLDTAVHMSADGTTTKQIPRALQPAWRTFFQTMYGTDTPFITPETTPAGSVQAFRDHIFALMTAVPDATTLAQAPTLERWCVIRDRQNCRLIGRVRGHPILRENARATTSALFRIAAADGWARTWSRIYRLLDPDPSFFLDLQRDERLQADTEIVWEMMPPPPDR